MKLTGNTILITGGTSGIGRALAEEFHDRGNRVIIAGRRQDRLDEIAAARPDITGIALDVDDTKALAAFADRVRREFPELNIVFNNAGFARDEDLTGDLDLVTAQAIIETNIVAVLNVTGALLPQLRAQDHAAFVTTTSGLAFVPRSNYPTYCATKAFLHSWLQSLRTQLSATSIEVLELVPPYVQTEFGGDRQLNDPAAMPLAEFISEVLAILENGDTPNGEILVDRVKPLRWAERDGRYDQVYAGLNAG